MRHVREGLAFKFDDGSYFADSEVQTKTRWVSEAYLAVRPEDFDDFGVRGGRTVKVTITTEVED